MEVSTKIRFESNEVLSASIVDKGPKNIELELRSAPEMLQLTHGLMNPGDFIVIDVLSSGSKIPTVSCDYRIAEIQKCNVKDESATSKEFYIVGVKVSDSMTMLTTAIALLSSAFISIGLGYIVATTATGLTRRMWARYKIENLENALSLYREDLYDEIKDIKLNDWSKFKHPALASQSSIKKFLNDPEANSTVGELFDRARSQAISAELARDIHYPLSDLIDTKTDHYYFFGKEMKNPNKLIDFERDAIDRLVESRYRIDMGGIYAGLPLLVLGLNLLFVSAGPFRTVLQKWL